MSELNINGQLFVQWCKSAGYSVPEMCRLPTGDYRALRDDWRSGRDSGKHNKLILPLIVALDRIAESEFTESGAV